MLFRPRMPSRALTEALSTKDDGIEGTRTPASSSRRNGRRSIWNQRRGARGCTRNDGNGRGRRGRDRGKGRGRRNDTVAGGSIEFRRSIGNPDTDRDAAPGCFVTPQNAAITSVQVANAFAKHGTHGFRGKPVETVYSGEHMVRLAIHENDVFVDQHVEQVSGATHFRAALQTVQIEPARKLARTRTRRIRPTKTTFVARVDDRVALTN